MDIVHASAAFFKFGANSMGALGGLRGRTRREALAAILAWWSAFYMAGANESRRMGLNSAAVLQLCRSLETYMLAYLWRRGGMSLDESNGRFVLDGGGEIGLANLWRVMGAENPGVAERFRERFHQLRRSRNANLLIHGFNIPDGSVVLRARSFVMDVVDAWEKGLYRDSKMILGPVRPIYRGVSGGTLGKILAKALVERNRARAVG